MDKIKLTLEDLERLMEWRDNHQDLVRTCPTPLTEIEVFSPSGIHFKAFRKGDRISFHVYFNKKKLGKLDMLTKGANVPHGLTRVTKNTLSNSMSIEVRNELAQDVNTTYCSLMAFMTYAKEYVEVQTRTTAVHHTGATRNRKKGVTYILHRVSNRKGTGHHASPAHAFMVRGHYRHYKSGKTVWVTPFKKGEGEVKDKNYKI